MNVSLVLFGAVVYMCHPDRSLVIMTLLLL